MDIDNFDGGVVLKVFAQLGDIYVHRAGVEVVIVNPDGLERVVAFENLVDVGAQQAEQFRLLGGELRYLVADKKHLLLGVESKLSDFVHRDFLALLALYAAKDGLDSEHEFFHRERLRDIIVCADFEPFEDIVLKRFCRKEYDGYLGVDGAYFWSEVRPSF